MPKIILNGATIQSIEEQAVRLIETTKIGDGLKIDGCPYPELECALESPDDMKTARLDCRACWRSFVPEVTLTLRSNK